MTLVAAVVASMDAAMMPKTSLIMSPRAPFSELKLQVVVDEAGLGIVVGLQRRGHLVQVLPQGQLGGGRVAEVTVVNAAVLDLHLMAWGDFGLLVGDRDLPFRRVANVISDLGEIILVATG